MSPIRPNIVADVQAPNVLLMSGLFSEAMKLLNEAHEYFLVFGQDDQERIDASLKTLYSCEMSRITLRMSSIMAWLMAQRAVFTGKITIDEAARRYGLDFRNVCLVDNRMLHGILPSYVCFLLDRSLELYERVMRLDEQVKRTSVH